jgi:flagellar biosynthesis/type III secretory pathway protein FliH
MNAPHGGYARGTAPARPGDLAARTAEQQRKAGAAKHVEGAGDPYEAGFAAGWNRGFDAGFDGGFEAGYEAVVKQLKEAGLDVDSILSLTDEPGDEDE